MLADKRNTHRQQVLGAVVVQGSLSQCAGRLLPYDAQFSQPLKFPTRCLFGHLDEKLIDSKTFFFSLSEVPNFSIRRLSGQLRYPVTVFVAGTLMRNTTGDTVGSIIRERVPCIFTVTAMQHLLGHSRETTRSALHLVRHLPHKPQNNAGQPYRYLGTQDACDERHHDSFYTHSVNAGNHTTSSFIFGGHKHVGHEIGGEGGGGGGDALEGWSKLLVRFSRQAGRPHLVRAFVFCRQHRNTLGQQQARVKHSSRHTLQLCERAGPTVRMASVSLARHGGQELASSAVPARSQPLILPALPGPI
jgi:hypothetical protein